MGKAYASEEVDNIGDELVPVAGLKDGTHSLGAHQPKVCARPLCCREFSWKFSKNGATRARRSRIWLQFVPSSSQGIRLRLLSVAAAVRATISGSESR
jgi:hypothetical protein